MPKVPVLKPREVENILRNLGFEEVRQRGSHKQYRHADGRATTVSTFTDVMAVALSSRLTASGA